MTNTRILTLAVDADVNDHNVIDRIPRILKSYIDGVHLLDDRTVEGVADFEWGDDQPDFPLSLADARKYADEDGFVQVTLLIDKEQYMDFYAIGARKPCAEDELDLVHSYAFDFGAPEESNAEIVGVSGTDFVVNYTTCID